MANRVHDDTRLRPDHPSLARLFAVTALAGIAGWIAIGAVAYLLWTWWHA